MPSCLMILMLLLPTADAPPPAAVFHPLPDGARWEYRVDDEGGAGRQVIEAGPGDEPGSWFLSTASGLRRTRWTVSLDGDTARLHRVRARLGFLPVGRTYEFSPPLPFLKVGAGERWRWSWTGRARWQGGDLVRAEFSGSSPAVGPDGGEPEARWLLVEAEFFLESGVRHAYRAWYERGVGLVHQSAENYRKHLQRFSAP